MNSTEQLPHWRWDNVFAGIDTPDFREAMENLERNVQEFELYLQKSGVGEDAQAVATDPAQVVEGTVTRTHDIQSLLGDVEAYLLGRIDTDAFDEEAQAMRSRMQPLMTRLSVLMKRFTSWVGKVDLEAAAASSQLVKEHLFALERYQGLSEHLMGLEAEEVAETLNNTGGNAWSELYGSLMGRSTIAADIPGQEDDEYNLAELYQLQSNRERSVRKAAFEAELQLLERNEVVFAAAMNSIKGQVGDLAGRRGWQSALDESLYMDAMSEKSLQAMQEACRESFPVFRRYLRAKARFLGLNRLAWFDLFAPVSHGEPRRFEWAEAKTFVLDNFASYSEGLSGFAGRAFESGWLDAPSRKGKVNGAYCMSVPGPAESRILLNFGGTLDDVFTIAHELGHAYHNDCMYKFGRTHMQRSTPMTLAETASIFCETLILNALLRDADDATKLAILEQDLDGSNQVVVDIDSRFRFEHAVFEARSQQELSVNEFRQIMLDAQDATYGDGLEPDFRHPLMWAHKGHYYSSQRSYYNYPYTFGLLFGLGLFRVYQAEPAGFQERYEELLSTTGMADAVTLGSRFGIDIEDVDFWRQSLATYGERVDEYERLVEKFSG